MDGGRTTPEPAPSPWHNCMLCCERTVQTMIDIKLRRNVYMGGRVNRNLHIQGVKIYPVHVIDTQMHCLLQDPALITVGNYMIRTVFYPLEVNNEDSYWITASRYLKRWTVSNCHKVYWQIIYFHTFFSFFYWIWNTPLKCSCHPQDAPPNNPVWWVWVL